MPAKTGMKVTKDKMAQALGGILGLAMCDVLVGVPEDTSTRSEESDFTVSSSGVASRTVEKSPITNAALAYIHNNGNAAAGIPKRQFMEPGLKDSKPKVDNYYKRAAQLSSEGKREAAIRNLEGAGTAAKSAIKRVIQAGDFVPLSDATLRARLARRNQKRGLVIAKGAEMELAARAAGQESSTEFAKPLIDSAQMLKSIEFVVRKDKPVQEVQLLKQIKKEN